MQCHISNDEKGLKSVAGNTTECQVTKYIFRSGQEIVMYTMIHIMCNVLISGKL
jgi:hypothetical protein